MYTLSRERSVAPAHGAAAVEWTKAWTARAREVTEKHIDAWVRIGSPGAGSISWTLWDDTLRDIEAVVDALDGDAALTRMTAEAEPYFVGQIDDRIFTMFHHAFLRGEHQARYKITIDTTIASGSFNDALDGGLAIARYATEQTGHNTAFVLNFTGPYNGVRWATGYPDIDRVDRSEQTLMSDPGWRALLGTAGAHFAPSQSRSLDRRLT